MPSEPWTSALQRRFFRRKHQSSLGLETQLRRCLNIFDVTLLGVGHMIGAGIYVMTGTVVHNIAGPSIVLSFLVAGVAAFLSALCYAEFGSRFPKAGSAYTYAYVGMGELWAFIIGWNIVLEHMLSAAAVARSWSGYLDQLTGQAISNGTISITGHWRHHHPDQDANSTTPGHAPEMELLGDYPDAVAVLCIVVVSIFMAIGSKASTAFNSTFTCINLLVISLVVGYGAFFVDFELWAGRFFPYGVDGMLKGAAKCFFAYIGFDGLATAGEETKNPARVIPLATFISMTLVTVAYMAMSGTLTLMVPYNLVVDKAAFADAFARRGAHWAQYVVSVGAIAGMTTSLVGSMFALPRCIYAMADDGLIFGVFAKVNRKTQVPVIAVVVFGIMTAIIAFLLDVDTLVDFLSIGTLLAYTIVSVCVILMRYSSHEGDNGGQLLRSAPFASFFRHANIPGLSVKLAVAVLCAIYVAFGLAIQFVGMGTWIGRAVVIIIGALSLLPVGYLYMHKQTSAQISFKVPFVPVLPALSIFFNIMMMTHLDGLTFIRLAVWMVIGMAIYLLYGMRHSKEEARDILAAKKHDEPTNAKDRVFPLDSHRNNNNNFGQSADAKMAGEGLEGRLYRHEREQTHSTSGKKFDEDNYNSIY